MATVSSGIVMDANYINLKEIDNSRIRKEIPALMMPEEVILQAFETIRDQVIFTNKRIFVVNVQGLTGKKVAYFSYPYSKIQYYGIETAGLLDFDSELIVAFSNGARLQFDFRDSVDIKDINLMISSYIL